MGKITPPPPVAHGREMGYAERTTNFTTTIVGGSPLVDKISGLSVTVVGAGRPVVIEFQSNQVLHSVANTYVAVQMIADGVLDQNSAISAPSTTVGETLSFQRRKVLTVGTSYTFEVGVTNSATGTATIKGNAAAPMFLAVTER